MNNSDGNDKVYNANQLMALIIICEDLQAMLDFMENMGLAELEKSCHQSLSIVMEVLKQKERKATLHIKNEIDNVVEVDFSKKRRENE